MSEGQNIAQSKLKYKTNMINENYINRITYNMKIV